MLAYEKTAALEASRSDAAPGPNRQHLPAPRWLRVPGACQYSGLNRSVLYTLLSAGKVRSHKIGGSRVVDRFSLDSFIESQPAA